MKSRIIEGIEKHSGQWIALDESRTRIIVSGKSFREVVKKASKVAIRPSYMKVPRLDASFSP